MRINVSKRQILLVLLFTVACYIIGNAEPIINLRYATFDAQGDEPAIWEPLGYQGQFIEPYGYYLVSLDSRITAQKRGEIESLGTLVAGYVPEDTYILRLTPGQLRMVQALPYVVFTGLYQPAYKLDTELHFYIGDEDKKRQELLLWVDLFRGADVERTIDKLQYMGISVEHKMVNPYQRTLVLYTKASNIPSIARLVDVEWVQLYPQLYLLNNQTTWVVQSNVTNSRPLWDKGIQGEDQMVGVLDSGLDYGSCFFRDNAHASPGPSHRKVVAYRNYGGNSYDSCSIGHGTHVCGTIAGEDIYGGNSQYNGVAPKARITFGDIQGSSYVDCYLGTLSLNTGLPVVFGDSFNDGAFVHSNSWGSTSNTYDGMAKSVDNFMWGNKSFLVLFAAGNSGPGAGTLGTPATAKDIVTVGATRRPNNHNTVASFSSRGPTPDQRIKPDVCVPGENVTSARNKGGDGISPTCNTVGGFSGTSMACPGAAGAALLVRQYFTEGWYPSGTKNPHDAMEPSAALVKAVLINSCDNMAGDPRPSFNQGWGRIHLLNTLYFQGNLKNLWVMDDKVGLATGQSHTYELEVTASNSPLYITLVWTDKDGNTGAGKALVNDLDLRFTYGSTTYVGNRFSGGWSVAGGLPDNTNPVECIYLQSLPSGAYRIVITGANVPVGEMFTNAQPYALVVRGNFVMSSGENDPPAAPKNLEAYDTPDDEGGSITIEWSLSADDGAGDNDVIGYNILRSQSESDAFSKIGQVGAGVSGYQDQTTSDGTWYYYKVQADDGVYKTDSEVVGPVTSVDNSGSGNSPPPPVTNLFAFDTPNDSGGSITLTWTKSAHDGAGEDDVTGYTVLRRKAGQVSLPIATLNPGSEEYIDQTVEDGVDYYYKVRVSDGEYETTSSETGPVQSEDNGIPTAPENLTANAGDGLVQLSWDPVNDQDLLGYRLYRSIKYNEGYERIAETDKTNFDDAGVVNGTTYYYFVTSYDAAGHESEGSEIVSARPMEQQANHPPTIELAGYLNSYVSSQAGGTLFIAAMAKDTDGISDVQRIDVCYQHAATGLSLFDNGQNGDAAAGDGIFMVQLPVAPGAPEGDYLLELQAVDRKGATSAYWPYFTIEASGYAALGSSQPLFDNYSNLMLKTILGIGTGGTKAPAPIIWAGGVIDPGITYQQGGTLTYQAVVTAGGAAVQRVELYFAGQPTGLILNDDGINGDMASGDSIYTFQAQIPAFTPSGEYLLTIVATDTSGEQSTTWPYLSIH